ncbi:flavodoxin [Agrilactobacillus yilanensis]|uniref:Flavodoxin n=1 Tax=Agrilactobacillus yilanensis TaxID=2485997 RepID=A0ABW4J577_9LACO|nr:flavodoxin [Agrilactobacillus yilanensis]
MKKKIGLVLGLLIVFAGLAHLDISRSQPALKQATAQTTTKVKHSARSSKTPAKKNNAGRILIVFFSRSGTNYPDTTLKIGHTQRIANEIARVTGGTKYEIVAAKAYPKNYQATVDRAEKEQQRDARPAIKQPLPDISKYDTIFIGYPIWWSDLPMPVRTFMDNVDMNGKTVIPFSTNAGSGWGDTLSTLKQQYPKATFKKGFSIEGTQADHAQKKIDRWLRQLGYR